MVKPKEAVDAIYPCEFYRPEDIMDPEVLYTVPEVARLLQGLEPDDTLDDETESVLMEWTIPWIMINADELVIADPTNEDEPGYYGLRTE